MLMYHTKCYCVLLCVILCYCVTLCYCCPCWSYISVKPAAKLLTDISNVVQWIKGSQHRGTTRRHDNQWNVTLYWMYQRHIRIQNTGTCQISVIHFCETNVHFNIYALKSNDSISTLQLLVQYMSIYIKT